jgi:type IV pilus assembly protein PilQ
MRRISALVAAALVVPFFGANHASANDVRSTGDVTAVSVSPSSGRANVHIAVSGETQVLDFVLNGPDRIVLDISPARLSSVPAYDRAPRGGINNVRFTQYEQNIVRVVLDMDKARAYEVTRGESGIVVSVETDASSFSGWNSRMSADASAALVNEATAAAAQAQQQPPPITIRYNEQDIKTVIANIAEWANVTILPSAQVTGLVSGSIVNQQWNVALRELLDVNGYAMTVEPNGIIKVDTYANINARQQTERLTTRTVDVNYARAGSLAETLRGLLYRDCSATVPGATTQPTQQQSGDQIGRPTVLPGCIVRGSIMADTLSSKLVITEVASRIDELLGHIQDLDVRTKQVSIKAEIFLVNRTSIEDIGVSYDIGTSSQFFNSKVQRIDPSTRTPVDINGDGVPDFLGGGTAYEPSTNIVNLGGNALAAVSNASTSVLNPALQLIYSTALGKFDLTTFLDLLQETRLADVQASPTVTTMDNHEAVIFMGEETPIRTVQSQGGNTAVVQTLVQFKETGITLRVTPHVTNNGQVSMRISAQRSSPEAGSSDIGLIFTKQTSDNSLLVADGETAVIGGITLSQISVSKVGIPILVDLPFIGKLFGQTTTRTEKRELLILVTPHIVDDGSAGQDGDL